MEHCESNYTKVHNPAVRRASLLPSWPFHDEVVAAECELKRVSRRIGRYRHPPEDQPDVPTQSREKFLQADRVYERLGVRSVREPPRRRGGLATQLLGHRPAQRLL